MATLDLPLVSHDQATSKRQSARQSSLISTDTRCYTIVEACIKPQTMRRESKRSRHEISVIACVVTIGCLLTARYSLANDVRPAGATFRDCPNCPEMVVIPPGRFVMGSSEAETTRDLAAVPHDGGLAALLGVSDWQSAKKFMGYEHPQHEVTISKSFALGRYPVMKEEFASFVRDTGYSTGPCVIYAQGARPSVMISSGWLHPGFTQSDHDPVVCVSWNDAQAYIRWLNRKSQDTASATGPYHLPSEAEWEYAARAGTTTARWWGNQMEAGRGHISGYDGEPAPGTAPVGSFPPNPFGLYDILGNAAEVAEDCWHDTYAGAPSDGSAWLAGNCSLRSTRGSAWQGPPWASRSATRSGQDPKIGANTNGFRVAKTLP